MLFEVGLAGHAHFEADQFVASVFEAAHDGGDEASLDAVGFDGDKGSFGVGHFIELGL